MYLPSSHVRANGLRHETSLFVQPREIRKLDPHVSLMISGNLLLPAPRGSHESPPLPSLWSSPLITNLSVFSRVAINVSTQSHQLRPDSNKIVHINYKALPSVRQIMPNRIICFCLYLDHFPSFLPSQLFSFYRFIVPSWQDLYVFISEIWVLSGEINPLLKWCLQVPSTFHNG